MWNTQRQKKVPYSPTSSSVSGEHRDPPGSRLWFQPARVRKPRLVAAAIRLARCYRFQVEKCCSRLQYPGRQWKSIERFRLDCYDLARGVRLTACFFARIVLVSLIGDCHKEDVFPPKLPLHRAKWFLLGRTQFALHPQGIELWHFSHYFPTFSVVVLSAGTRWVNLWWPMDIPGDTGSGGCVFSAGVGEIGASVFVGNTVLVVGILLGTFLLHVAVVSGVEAYWLAKVSFVSVFFRSVM